MTRYTRALEPHKTRAPAPVGFAAAVSSLPWSCSSPPAAAIASRTAWGEPCRLATRLFSVAFDQISERYVQQVALSNLTDAELTNLSKLDAKFEVRRGGGRLELREEGVQIAMLDTPTNEA